ncbi:glycoside hydrolase superfamily [Pisolithus marmoratus]|nr:glycoside hydrolase superfamily [Pisolithus marmoratus]
MPTRVPSSIDGWWCPVDCEHAFLGFSYEVTSCQSLSQLKADFANMRKTFNARYVRLYGACDKSGFYNNIIEAAWQNTLGVHALIWFGFDGGSEWEMRRDDLFDTLHTNPKAPFVTRGVQFGSEPLFDDVLSRQSLTEQVVLAKKNLSDVRIPVTVSELAYGYQERAALDVLGEIDFINAHILPFFSTNATTGGAAWPLVQQDMDWFIQNGKGKKIYFDENGWPSVTSSGVQPNSANAVASVSSEEAYFQMLDSKCEALKKGPCGGVGWFAHIYSDQEEAGYGIYDTQGKLKFPFQPRSSC